MRQNKTREDMIKITHDIERQHDETISSATNSNINNRKNKMRFETSDSL